MVCLVTVIVQDWDLLLHDEEDIHFGHTRYDGIHYSLARRIVIQSRGYRNTITRKRDKRAKRITSGLCSRSCYTWVPNFSPLTLSYIAKQREWYMANIKVHSKFIRVCAGVNMGVHGSAVDYWLLTKGC